MKGKTLVIGASTNPERYSNKAIKMLREHQIETIGLGLKSGQVEDVIFDKTKPQDNDIETITLYIGPKHQPEYYDYIIARKPKRVIFNPGTENPELENLLSKNNIEPLEACTLVLLSTGQF